MPIDPQLSQHLVDQAPDAVIFSDLTGAIRVWNDAAVAVFGHTREEAIGQQLDLIVPERFREAMMMGNGDSKEVL